MKKLLAALLVSLAVLGCDHKENVPENSVELDIPKDVLEFGAEASTTVAYVVCEGVVPDLSSDQAWCTVTQEPTTSTKTHKYTVSVSSNESTSDRSATISVTAQKASASISVIQAGQDGLEILTTEISPIPAEGGSVTVKVSANCDYSVSVSGSWLSQSETKSPMVDGEYVFTASKNVGMERSATVTFASGELSRSIVVKQSAGAVTAIEATASQIAARMYPGWNLGNTMEATGSGGLGAETSWQGTPTSQALLDLVARSGFRAVRIPCSWDFHSDSSGKIDSAWMDRVREVVDYCISAGLYVELNDHWDNGWIEVLGFSRSSDKYVAVTDEYVASKTERLKDLWTQIATYFKDYDEHLLFAGLNEPFQQYDLFNSRHKELTPILEKYCQAFVDAVRSTGGNNANRVLVVSGPSTNIASTYSYFHLPEDSAKDALMVEVHYYDPWNFCSGGSFYYYGSENHVSGSSHNCTYGEESYLKGEIAKMQSKYTSKGVPVIIGEYAADRQIMPSGESQSKHDASIRLFYKLVNKYATDYGMVPFAWDTNNPTTTGSTGTIFKRQDCTVFNQDVVDAIMEGVKSGSWPN